MIFLGLAIKSPEDRKNVLVEVSRRRSGDDQTIGSNVLYMQPEIL